MMSINKSGKQGPANCAWLTASHCYNKSVSVKLTYNNAMFSETSFSKFNSKMDRVSAGFFSPKSESWVKSRFSCDFHHSHELLQTCI